ncbi:hypothetical protein DEI93_07180 [Curtobacterium sp. MCBD17_035]|uniref:hypothetical protein n=1 Tax=Curtobacterium sp. MCBD17_035 TaxID=2175673 RepID=UPI000DA7A23A|nr:hypothetical protein [Curtobacterium sp. MCBD17_035]WIB68804.1 hypothetical protein DEI93_07180 [Curtobacterium sp. MCBD17_035]
MTTSLSMTVGGVQTVVQPLLMLGYADTRNTNTVVHTVLGAAEPDVMWRPPSLRTGTFQFLFDNSDDAQTALTIVQNGAPALMDDTDRPELAMSFVASGSVSLELDDQTQTLWVLSVGFQEV